MRKRTPVHFRGTERFELVSLLGRGASGVVYEAIDRERGGRVALKVLGERSPEAIAHFKNEFRSLQEIRHPHLVELKELIFEGGHWLLSMQLVRGVDIVAYAWGETARDDAEAEAPSLPLAASAEDDTIRAWERPGFRERVTSWAPRAFSEARLRQAFEQLAQGLSALHAEGKIHRDVKRSNVLVDARGHVTILDFGLVAELDALGSVEQGALAGTPATMAPEQAALERIGPASDWYSFGVVLYQALTGRAPFVGSRAEILLEKRRALPEAPALVARNVPRDLSELCMELLALEPTQRPSGASVLARVVDPRPRVVSSQPAVVARSDGVFVGRKSELSSLEHALDRVSRGEAVTIVLEGESGLGKTALVREFLASVPDRKEPVAIFAGRCFEREALPYKALDGVIDAVCAYLAELAPEQAEALLPADAAAIARAFPVLHRVLQGVKPRGDTSGLDPHAQRQRMFAALRELFLRLAGHRLGVVVMDDMQWADIDSMAMLSALLEPPAPPLLWILARRPGAMIARAPLPCEVSTIRLGALTSTESGALVGELLGADAATLSSSALAERIGEASGHPLFLREIARQIAATQAHSVAPRLDDALFQRVAVLEPTTRRLLELTAVAGRPTPQGVVADALIVGPDEAADATIEDGEFGFAEIFDRMAELRHAHLICTTGTHPNDTIETYHDRVREAVLAHLTPEARRLSHSALAAALERAATGDVEALALHWQEAGALERAHDYAVTAADQAAAALAFERAARSYKNAVELGAPSPARKLELERKLGDALANAGRGYEAAEVYRSAAERAAGLESVALERSAAEQLLRSGHVEEGIMAVSAVLERLGIHTPKTRLLKVLSLAWLRFRIRLSGLRYRPRPETELTNLELARLDGAWMAATCLAMFDGIRSAELQCRTTLRALRAGTPLQLLRAHTSEVTFLALAGQSMRPRIERSLAAAVSFAEQLGEPMAHAWVALNHGASAFFLGDWQVSEEQCATAEAIFVERPGTSFELASARAFMVWAAMMRGRFAQVLHRVPDYVAEAEKRGDLYAATYQMTSFSNVAWLSRDDVPEARRMLALAESRWPSKDFDVPRYSNMVAAAHIELYDARGLAAHERIRRDWAQLRFGVAFRAQITRFGMRFVRGLSALAAYDASGERAFLADAKACARAIAAERVTWGECFAHILFFGVHLRRGDATRALSALEQAELRAQKTGMLLHHAVVRYRRGELVGGDEGRTLTVEALGFLVEQRIKNPGRMLDMLSPPL
jgi:serine/threonine protein kinase